MPGSGLISHFGLAKEVTWGTFVPPTDYLKFNSETLNLETEKIESSQLHSRRDKPLSYAGIGSVLGDSIHEAHPNGLGYLLHSFNSQVNTTLVNPGIYSHVFTPSNTPFSNTSQLQPYSLEAYRDFTGEAFRISGAVVNDLAISFGVGDPILMVTPTWIAKDVEKDTETSPSLETTRPFIWSDAVVKIDDVINGSLESIEFSGSQGCAGVSLLNATKRIAQLESDTWRTGTVSFAFRPNDLSMWDKYKDYTSTIKLEVIFTGDLISGADYFKLTLLFPRVRLTAFPVNVGGPGRVVVSVEADVEYDSVAGYMWEKTLINEITAY